MNETNETDNMVKNMLEEMDEAKKKLKAGKDFIVKACGWFLASFLVTIPLIAIGIKFESNTLITMAGLIRAILIAAFLVIMAPFGIPFEVLKGGISGSVRRYADIVVRSFVAELAFIAILVWTPLKNNPSMILLFVVLLVPVLFVNPSKVFSRRLVTVITIGLLVLTTISFFVPNFLKFTGTKLRYADQETGMPQRVDMEIACSDFGNYPFFGDKGESLRYYYINPKTDEIEVYLAVTDNITNRRTGDPLKLITRKVVDELEMQICARDRELKKHPPKKVAQTKQDSTSEIVEMTKKRMLAESILADASPKTGKYSKVEARPKPKLRPRSKQYRYAIFSAVKAGDEGRETSQIIANSDRGIFNVGRVDYGYAYGKAEYVVVVEDIITKSYPESGIFRGETSINMRVIDSASGKTVRFVNTTTKQNAFDSQTARKFSMNAAIEIAKKRLKDAM